MVHLKLMYSNPNNINDFLYYPQFRFGQALKTENTWGGVLLDGLKRLYITKIKGFDPAKLCVVTLLMEGSAEEVSERESKLNNIAAQFGGIPAGATNGENGYTLTFVIAYLRVCIQSAIEYGSHKPNVINFFPTYFTSPM